MLLFTWNTLVADVPLQNSMIALVEAEEKASLWLLLLKLCYLDDSNYVYLEDIITHKNLNNTWPAIWSRWVVSKQYKLVGDKINVMI